MYVIILQILKKSNMRTIIGSSARDHVLMILFQLYGTKARVFDSNLFWFGQYDHFPILEDKLIKFSYDLIQCLILSYRC